MVKIKRSLKSKLHHWNVVDYLIVLFFVLYMAVALVPILNVLSLSFTRNEYAITHKGMLFPNFKYFTVAPYGAVFRSEAIYTSLLISIVVTVTATVIHVATALLAGFALSVKKLPFRRCLMMIVLFTMMFNGGLIPLYLTISSYNMVDTFAVLVLPGAVSAYSIILMRNFISNIPSSLLEAAELDGANPFQVLVKIVLPLSVPIIATISLFCAIGKWNDWTTGAIYIKSNRWLWPFQNVLQNIVVNADPQNSTGIDFSEGGGVAFSNALIVISIVPVTLMYLLTQKFLIKGMMLGSVKG